jgi:hypothetical protein
MSNLEKFCKGDPDKGPSAFMHRMVVLVIYSVTGYEHRGYCEDAIDHEAIKTFETWWAGEMKRHPGRRRPKPKFGKRGGITEIQDRRVQFTEKLPEGLKLEDVCPSTGEISGSSLLLFNRKRKICDASGRYCSCYEDYAVVSAHVYRTSTNLGREKSERKQARIKERRTEKVVEQMKELIANGRLVTPKMFERASIAYIETGRFTPKKN